MPNSNEFIIITDKGPPFSLNSNSENNPQKLEVYYILMVIGFLEHNVIYIQLIS